MVSETNVVQLLADLIAIPSVNPECTEDASIAGEKRLAEFVAEYLEGRGFKISWDERVPGRPNVLAAYGEPAAARTLMVEAHLDTVGVEGMLRPPFTATVEQGRLYARGACDTKGPMAAALAAFQPEVLDCVASMGWRLLFVGAMGEERGNQGAERLVRAGLLSAQEAIVLEPTGLEVVHAHKGALWYQLTTRGRAGHGSNPDAARNAVLDMCAAIALLRREVDEQRTHRHDPLLGQPTLNIGRIRGGTAVNIVPDSCLLDVDRRSVPGENHADILARVRQGLDRLCAENVLQSYDLAVLKDGPAFHTPVGSRLMSRLAESSRACGVPPRTAGSAWYSDAGALSQRCGEIAVFGPGHIAQAHTAEEFIDLDALQKGSDILKHLLLHLEDNAASGQGG